MDDDRDALLSFNADSGEIEQVATEQLATGQMENDDGDLSVDSPQQGGSSPEHNAAVSHPSPAHPSPAPSSLNSLTERMHNTAMSDEEDVKEEYTESVYTDSVYTDSVSGGDAGTMPSSEDCVEAELVVELLKGAKFIKGKDPKQLTTLLSITFKTLREEGDGRELTMNQLFKMVESVGDKITTTKVCTSIQSVVQLALRLVFFSHHSSLLLFFAHTTSPLLLSSLRPRYAS
jgi:hypothetical protein